MSKSGEILPIFTPAFSGLEVVGLVLLVGAGVGVALTLRANRRLQRTVDALVAYELRQGDAARRGVDAVESELENFDA